MVKIVVYFLRDACASERGTTVQGVRGRSLAWP
jgi:hypothetical protein